MADFNLDKRVESLQSVPGLTNDEKSKVAANLKAADVDGDWDKFVAKPEIAAFDAAKKTSLKWAYALGNWSLQLPVDNVPADDVELVSHLLTNDASVTSLRALALKYGVLDLIKLIATVHAGTSEDDLKSRATELRQRLYVEVPTAVICRLIEQPGDLNHPPIPVHAAAKNALIAFLKQAEAFDFKAIDCRTLTDASPILSTVPQADRAGVIAELKKIDFVHTVSELISAATPEVLLAFYSGGLTDPGSIIRSNPQAISNSLGDAATIEDAQEIIAKAREYREAEFQSSNPEEVLHVVIDMVDHAEVYIDLDTRQHVLSQLRQLPSQLDFLTARDNDLSQVASQVAQLQDTSLLTAVPESNRAAVSSELQGLHFALRVAPTSAIFETLLDDRFDSAARVVEFSKEEFIARYTSRFGQVVAGEIYDKARKYQRSTTSVQPYVKFRIECLSVFVTDNDLRNAIAEAMRDANGDWTAIRDTVPGVSAELKLDLDFGYELSLVLYEIDTPPWKRIDFVQALKQATEADASGNPVRKFLSLSDVGRKWNTQDIAAAITFDTVPTDEQAARNSIATRFREGVFSKVPTSVMVKMVTDGEIPIQPDSVRDGVLQFFGNRPDFDFTRMTVRAEVAKPGALNGVSADIREAVIKLLESMSRSTSLGYQAAPVVTTSGLSSFRISEIPQDAFVAAYKDSLGSEQKARQVHANAVDMRIRNEQTLMALQEAVRGTGIGLLDGDRSVDQRITDITAKLREELGEGAMESLPDLRKLFGSIDTCECGHCNSVYSPSAYLVELLNFLRNNNLDPKNPHYSSGAIEGTPLGHLFRRRPDIGNLKLTCENAFTVLPHIDLANEVMESFVDHLEQYRRSGQSFKDRSATIDVFDVDDETSGELLSQPQHINQAAYKILSDAVHPFSLPYHRPIDSARISLRYLKTSRHELMDVFRTAPTECFAQELRKKRPELVAEYEELYKTRLDRAVDAEFLGLIQEEYVILCREAFWKKRFFEIRDEKPFTEQEYRAEIGVHQPHEYFGFVSEPEMETNLKLVAAYLLPRTGLLYSELVDLIRTRFVNPLYPQGRSLQMFSRLPGSYRFLASLVVQDSEDPEIRFGKLIAYVIKEDPSYHCSSTLVDELREWIYSSFEPLGKLIVLNTAHALPVGNIYILDNDKEYLLGRLNENGLITRGDTVTGRVESDGRVLNTDGHPYATHTLIIRSATNTPVGFISPDGLFAVDNTGTLSITWRGTTYRVAKWTFSTVDDCDVDKVRIEHLDGTAVTANEFDRMHRFIRLWRRLGWNINEVDSAITAFSRTPDPCQYPGADDFEDECDKPKPCVHATQVPEITAHALEQIVHLKKLQEETAAELVQLLALWSEIDTFGDKSLYSRLFLTHNIKAIDKVFVSNERGELLAPPYEKIKDHIPVLVAALRYRESDLLQTISWLGWDLEGKGAAELTLENVSHLYRLVLLAKLLKVAVTELPDVFDVVDDALENASATRDLLKFWEDVRSVGISPRYLRHLLKGIDSESQPVGITQIAWLKTKKSIFDGLRAIDSAHADLSDLDPDPALFTADVVRSKSSLLFDQPLVDAIVQFVEGTSIYSTNAPSGLTIVIPDADRDAVHLPRLATAASLKEKLAYVDDGTNAALEIIGILTPREKQDAIALAAGNREWHQAIERAGRQPIRFFRDRLAWVLGEDPAVVDNVFAGKAALPDAPCESSPICLLAPDTGESSAGVKRRVFLKYFLPYLRDQLSQQLIYQTLAPAVGIDFEQAKALLEVRDDVEVVGSSDHILHDDLNNVPALKTIAAIREVEVGSGWKGYLYPTEAARYQFSAIELSSGAQPASLWLQNAATGTQIKVDFSHQQEDPNNVWFSDDIPLEQSLYELHVVDRSAEEVSWQTPPTTRTRIPTSALMPLCSEAEYHVFHKVERAGRLVLKNELDPTEIRFWHSRQELDFNDVNIALWKRIRAYVQFRNEIPKREFTLVNLLQWANEPTRFQIANRSQRTASHSPDSELAERISKSTGWSADDVRDLILPEHFNLGSTALFQDVGHLTQLKRAIDLQKLLGASLRRLFRWAVPTSNFGKSNAIADDIRTLIRGRFDQESWEQVAKPLNDQLRTNQRDALIAFLLVQPEIREWGVKDANGLFEFFLIDVLMESCMETSRIKAAISSAQLFIQRSLIGLEEKYGVEPKLIHSKRWEWMQKYRVWEANRKVFLYPENWIRPELRDDKSPQFKDFETELLQNDSDASAYESAAKGYIAHLQSVANLLPVGLFVEEKGRGIEESTIHVFGRSQDEPYSFFHRRFVVPEREWTPWQEMPVDISSPEDSPKGSYLSPVVVNGRLFVFFPQLVKKRSEAKLQVETRVIRREVKHGRTEILSNSSSLREIASETERAEFPLRDLGPSESWELALCFTEFKNGTWSPKRVSPGTYTFTSTTGQRRPKSSSLGDKEDVKEEVERERRVPNPLGGPDIVFRYKEWVVVGYRQTETIETFVASRDSLISASGFVLTPRLNKDGSVAVEVTHSSVSDAIHFTFQNDTTNGPEDISVSSPNLRYHFSGRTLRTLQKDPAGNRRYFSSLPEVTRSTSTCEIHTDPSTSSVSLFHAATSDLRAASEQSVEKIHEVLGELPKSDFGERSSGLTSTFHELTKPNSLYNWELAFHAPMSAAEAYLRTQRFDDALKICHYVFNPFDDSVDTSSPEYDVRFWKFLPFRHVSSSSVVQMMNDLAIGNNSDETIQQIRRWRDNPFQPHLLARLRPSAYMKYTVMKYIEILIEYGDYYFRQNTLETVPLAIQQYVTASHIFGPAPQAIPRRGKIKPKSYNDLAENWDAFGNALVELELLPLQVKQRLISTTSAGEEAKDTQMPGVYGFAQTLYFCIPDNPRLRELRAKIDDRLFKIRHCQDINGVFRRLPLFEPPIDPALLVQAAAQGVSLSSVLNDLNSPMPNYRFGYLIQKALELCGEVKSLGAAFLAAKEKRDSEKVAHLRSTHDTTIQKLILEVRRHQLEEARKSFESLRDNRRAPMYRLRHFLQLIGEDLSAIPEAEDDFAELANLISSPVDESGLKLSQYEKTELDKAKESADRQRDIGVVETLASVFHALPVFNAHGTPLGVGMAVCWGFPYLADATSAVARGMRIKADELAFHSSRASRLGGFQRQIQERIYQANVSGYEIKNIDRQIAIQEVRIKMMQQELANQEKQIENAAEVEEYLKSKYTNQELYLFMETQLRSLHKSAYKLAYELARKAEKVFQFERGLTTTDFIQPGYWDDGRDGMFSGEQLYQACKRLENAHVENRAHDFELTKHVSLRQLNPFALLALRQFGFCDFEVPETVYDADFPGHYKRRIKSVAVSIPAVVGPHTSVGCTLRLLEHKVRFSSALGSGYPQVIDEEDPRFGTMAVPIASAAISEGNQDAGVFELEFRGERFLPFEGAGAISRWRLQLPEKVRSFDYDTIADVILHIRYTSADGGDTLRQAAEAHLETVLAESTEQRREEGYFVVLDLKHEFSPEWYRFAKAGTGGERRKLEMKGLLKRMPYLASSRDVQATAAFLVSAGNGLADKKVKLLTSESPRDFTPAQVGLVECIGIMEDEIAVETWTLEADQPTNDLDWAWLIVKLKL